MMISFYWSKLIVKFFVTFKIKVYYAFKDWRIIFISYKYDSIVKVLYDANGIII